MKKEFTFVMAGVLAVSAIAVVGCSKDDEQDDMFYGLDVTNNTPVTRNTAMDGFEINQGGNNLEYKKVPTNPDECMLWAIVTIAVKNNIPITVNNGESTKSINERYTATEAYNDIKGLAQGRNWPVCDVYGGPIPDEGGQVYEAGAMPPSIAASVAKQAGIMQGTTMYFRTYNELLGFINEPTWKMEHPAGSYIINNERYKHASICNGVDKNNSSLKI